ncbi:MAG TPA: diaminopimelate decarboxylase [Ignavibacteria bacterium]|nr:diaminopimelate decarboxylase [Ignavibacteria bacterium]
MSELTPELVKDENHWLKVHPFFKQNSLDELKKYIDSYESPAFLYSRRVVTDQHYKLSQDLPSKIKIFYAQKSNPNPEILKHLKSLGVGCDTASLGEISAAIDAGFVSKDIMFTGPGKTEEELQFAVRKNLMSVNVESIQELELLDKICEEQRRKQGILVRINPKFEAGEENRIIGGMGVSKFGIDIDQIDEFMEALKKTKNIRLKGIHIFNSSQILFWKRIYENTIAVIETAMELEKKYNVSFEVIDLGGGFGIPYSEEEFELDIDKLKKELNFLYRNKKYSSFLEKIKMIYEPGRYLSGQCGIYITKVLYTKESGGKKVAIIDGGIHHMIRPALIGQSHPIVNLSGIIEKRLVKDNYLIAGPLCTSLDEFNQASQIEEIKQGDILAVLNAGAYGYTESMPLFLSHKPAKEIFIN